MAFWLHNQSQRPLLLCQRIRRISLSYVPTQTHTKSKRQKSLQFGLPVQKLPANFQGHRSWQFSCCEVFFGAEVLLDIIMTTGYPPVILFPQLWDIASSSLISHQTPASCKYRESFLNLKLGISYDYIIWQHI